MSARIRASAFFDVECGRSRGREVCSNRFSRRGTVPCFVRQGAIRWYVWVILDVCRTRVSQGYVHSGTYACLWHRIDFTCMTGDDYYSFIVDWRSWRDACALGVVKRVGTGVAWKGDAETWKHIADCSAWCGGSRYVQSISTAEPIDDYQVGCYAESGMIGGMCYAYALAQDSDVADRFVYVHWERRGMLFSILLLPLYA